MSNSHPAVLLDVDGPLNPYDKGRKHLVVPSDGYTRHYIKVVGTTYALWLNPEHGDMLSGLAACSELMWCTAWGEEANTHIAPLIGLPTLPVIELGPPFYSDDAIWKRGAVEEQLGERPLAWFDDQFERGDFAWAKTRSAAGHPTLLIDVSPTTGILPSHVDSALAWAKALAPSTTGA